MVHRDLVGRKVARARAWLSDAAGRLDHPRDEFLANAELRDLATFYLFLAMQESLDLAAHWASDEGWEPADDAAGTFEVLARHQAISPELAGQLRQMVHLRNRIAHGYATVDHARLHEESSAAIASLRAFLIRISDAAGL
jgi:uncharacterized protein YutE (UPF0331/DUF86 family)